MELKNRFELGEIDPWNWGQFDGDEYQLGVAWLENFQILPQGGINRRRGYKRMKKIAESGGAVRLIHIAADDTHYVIILLKTAILLYTCGDDTLNEYPLSAPYPTSDEGLRSLRYCTRKNVAALVCGECAPFCLTVSGGALTHTALTISKEVKLIETKPDEGFPNTNSITNYDTAIDEGLVSGEIHPKVIAFIGNRLWLAHTAEQPNKIWVSKRTEDITNVNLSTYNMYATVFEEYLAFSGRNVLGTAVLDKLDGNGNLLRTYSEKVLTAKADPKGEAPSGSSVDYGVDPTRINRTAYFKGGSLVKDNDESLTAGDASEAIEEEYTDEAIAQTEAEYTRKMNMFAARDFKYLAPGGLISANCYGVEIFVISMNPQIAVDSGSWSSSSEGKGWGIEGKIPGVKTKNNGQDGGKIVSKVSSTASTGTVSLTQTGVGVIAGALAGNAAGAITGTVSLVNESGTGPTLTVSSEANTTVESEDTEITGGGSLDDQKDGSSKGSGSGKNSGASFGVDIVIQQLVPFTAWGTDWDTASIKAAGGIAAATQVFATGGYALLMTANPIIGAAAIALGLDPLYFATLINLMAGDDLDDLRDTMKNRCRDNLNLSVELTKEGKINHTVADVGLNPGSDIHPDYLTNIVQYIKTKYSLYSKLQPFVGIYHQVKVEEYSTADCGFTFEISGGTGEFIQDIAENQHIMILTAKSERMADYTINGESQLVRTISGEGCEFVKSSLSGAALYMMRTGGRSMQKLQWQPAMNAPGMIQTNQRNSDILDGFQTRFLYASETYPKKIRLISDDGRVIGVQLLLGTEAFYRETTSGKILDMQSFKVGQDEQVYAARQDGRGAIWLDLLTDSIGRGYDKASPDPHIFLDSWQKNGDKAEYTDEAVCYDPETDRVYLYDDAVPAGTDYYIGYPYMSKLRTLPAVGFGDLRSLRLPRIKVRLRDSCMPFINGYPEGDELNPNIITDQQRRRSGVFDVPIPGTNHRDAAYELYTNYPDSLSILALCEETV